MNDSKCLCWCFIKRLPADRQTKGTCTRCLLYSIKGDCTPMLLINQVSKLILRGFVDIYSNVEAAISLCQLNLSFILSNSQRSFESVGDYWPTHAGGPGALHLPKALRLDYTTTGCSWMKLDETELSKRARRQDVLEVAHILTAAFKFCISLHDVKWNEFSVPTIGNRHSFYCCTFKSTVNLNRDCCKHPKENFVHVAHQWNEGVKGIILKKDKM